MNVSKIIHRQFLSCYSINEFKFDKFQKENRFDLEGITLVTLVQVMVYQVFGDNSAQL